LNDRALTSWPCNTNLSETLLRADGETQDVNNSRVSSIYTADVLLADKNRAFIAGGIAACGAVTATHPFETVKIR
jgi:hypothetical protein